MATYILQKDLPDEIIFKRYLNSNYYISECGKVLSSQTDKFLKGDRRNGYLWFSLWINRIPKTISQHRLIAECFIPNPGNLPIVRHLNDNPFDVRISNLAWGTKSDNMLDAVKNGIVKNRPSPQGEKHRKAKLTKEIIELILFDVSKGMHYKEVALKYEISETYVYDIKKRKAWKHLKFA